MCPGIASACRFPSLLSGRQPLECVAKIMKIGRNTSSRSKKYALSVLFCKKRFVFAPCGEWTAIVQTECRFPFPWEAEGGGL